MRVCVHVLTRIEVQSAEPVYFTISAAESGSLRTGALWVTQEAAAGGCRIPTTSARCFNGETQTLHRPRTLDETMRVSPVLLLRGIVPL